MNEEPAKLEGITTPALVTGLLGLELARNHGADVELDPLKLSDTERRKRFGARIRLLRQALGMKQTDLAHKIGIVPQALNVWEVGKQEPNLKNLIALSRALNTTAGWLLGEEQ